MEVTTGVDVVANVGGATPVSVGERGTDGGGINVLIAVRKIGDRGVNVMSGDPVPDPVCGMSGHDCRVTGNCRQFEASTQTFRLKLTCCAPRQSRIRRPLISSAVAQMIPVAGSETLNETSLDMIRTACASSLTQNWHCSETTSIPVMGIKGVAVPALVLVGSAVSVICSVAIMVPMGVPVVSAGILHAPRSSIRNSATNKSLRGRLFIACTPSIVL